jgi:hypothetical protein
MMSIIEEAMSSLHVTNITSHGPMTRQNLSDY